MGVLASFGWLPLSKFKRKKKKKKRKRKKKKKREKRKEKMQERKRKKEKEKKNLFSLFCVTLFCVTLFWNEEEYETAFSGNTATTRKSNLITQ